MALGQNIERLAQIPLLGVMEPDALRLLAFSGETRIVLAEAVLFERGQRSDGGLLILSGSVSLIAQDGTAARFGEGALLGETALINETVQTHTAIANETTTLIRLPRSIMLRVLEEHPVSAQRILAYLAQRLHGRLIDQAAP